MPDYNDLEAKLEAAFATIIGAASVGTSNLFTGQDADDQALSCVIIHAAQREEIGHGTGIYRVRMDFLTRTNADGAGALAAHRTLTAKTFDAVLNTTSTALEAAASELTVVDLLEPESEHTVDGRRFEDRLTLIAVAAPNAMRS